MLTYSQALRRILSRVPSPRPVTVPLEEAFGLVLVRPIVARIDLPRFDNTAVDGYALPCLNDNGLPVPASAEGAALQVVGQSTAGAPFQGRVRPGQAVKISTGGVVPRGTESVVMQEQVKRQGNRLLVQQWPKPGQNIRRRGEDLRRGTPVLEKGAMLRPQEIGLLAALGTRTVTVYPRPAAAILVTGDEVRPPGERLRPGQIYESNGHLLTALLKRAGAQPVNLGVSRDTLRLLVPRIRRGIAYNLLLVSGGISVGEKDLVRAAARACGVEELLWRVSVKPGMPLFVGLKDRTLIFGLPGNPVSVYATFEEFVKPALFQLMGRRWRDGYTTPALLTRDLKVSATRRTHFVRVRCSHRNGQLFAEPVEGQGSHQLRSLSQANGWIRMVADQGPWPAGTPVQVKMELAPWE